MDATLEDMLVDHWAWLYAEDPEAAEKEIVDDEFDVEAELARINAEVQGVNDWEDA